MVQKLCNPFCQILDWLFLGDVLNNWILGSPTILQKMVQKLRNLFWQILDWLFFGDVLNNFGEMEQNRFGKKMVQKLRNLFCQILDWLFFGDVLNNRILCFTCFQIYIIKVFRLYIKKY